MSASVGLGMALRNADGRHDLAGLAVAALRQSSAIQACCTGWLPSGDSLDRSGSCPCRVADRQRTGPHRLVVDMHGAGAALCDAAAIFRAGQTDLVAQDQSSGVSGSMSTHVERRSR